MSTPSEGALKRAKELVEKWANNKKVESWIYAADCRLLEDAIAAALDSAVAWKDVCGAPNLQTTLIVNEHSYNKLKLLTLEAQLDEQYDVNRGLIEALGTIISLTHSWVITPGTAPCAANFDSIRDRAREALKKWGGE